MLALVTESEDKVSTSLQLLNKLTQSVSIPYCILVVSVLAVYNIDLLDHALTGWLVACQSWSDIFLNNIFITAYILYESETPLLCYVDIDLLLSPSAQKCMEKLHC